MLEATIAEVQDAMSSGQISSQWLTRTYLQRIDEIDRAGPTLRSIIEINPDAQEIAAALDEERRQRGPRGPLHGVPMVLKDNINTGDKMMTTAGSLALEGWHAPTDAVVAAKLRAAGAVILAKANLSEWANFRSTKSSSGWSSRGGQVLNPYALDRSTSGSSAGSAAAVAANLCTAAIGSETNGSIISPSSRTSLVGVKPTIGLVSQAGIIPISHTLDTAGPMTRCVADAAIILDAIAETKLEPMQPPANLKGVRIGVASEGRGIDPNVDRTFDTAVRVLSDLGAETVDDIVFEGMDELRNQGLTAMNYEFKADLNHYLAEVDPALPVHNLDELIEFNSANADRVMPIYGQERLLQSQATGSLEDEEYLSALDAITSAARQAMDSPMAEHKLDAIVAPSNSPTHLIDLVNGDSPPRVSTGQAAVLSRYPIVTVPSGYFRGLSLGVSFFGSGGEDAKLMRLAGAFEQAAPVRRPPRFLPSADMSSNSVD